jgi:serine/threonine-protein kinase
MRHSISLVAVVALIAAAAGIVAVLGNEAADRTQRGTGPGRVTAPPPGTKVVSVQRASAHAYDPFGGDGEHDDAAPLVVDRDPGTTWTTEGYQDGIEGAGKPGVGIYVDAKPQVAAVQLQVQTPAPGFHATIYAAPAGSLPQTVPNGWTKVGGGTVNAGDKRFKLSTNGKPYRYYLVWITKLAPGAERAEIAEIRLFEEKAT